MIGLLGRCWLVMADDGEGRISGCKVEFMAKEEEKKKLNFWRDLPHMCIIRGKVCDCR